MMDALCKACFIVRVTALALLCHHQSLDDLKVLIESRSWFPTIYYVQWDLWKNNKKLRYPPFNLLGTESHPQIDKWVSSMGVTDKLLHNLMSSSSG